METTSDPSTVEPFSSLSVLRRSHTMLLRRRQGDNGAALPPEEVIVFMKRAQATGRKIADEESRDSAQTILDYWYSAVIRDIRKTSSSIMVESLTLDEFDSSSEAPDLEVEAEAERKARNELELKAKALALDKELAAADHPTLQLLLLRLFNLDPVQSFPQRINCLLTDLADAEKEQRLAGILRGVDLVKLETAGGATEPNAISLADDSLFTSWPFLAALVKKRRSLRDLTTGWIKSGKASYALLEKGDLLDLASDFRDTTDAEREFLRFSREAATKRSQLQYGIIGTFFFVLIGLVIWLAAERSAQKKANTDLKATVTERDKALSDLRDSKAKEEVLVNAKLAQEAQLKNGLLVENADLKDKISAHESRLRKVSDFLKNAGIALTPELDQIVKVYKTPDPEKRPDNSILAKTLETSSATEVLPGSSIWNTDDASFRGSLGIYLSNPRTNKVYLTAPKFVLPGVAGSPVYAGNKRTQIATLSPDVDSVKDFKDLVLAEVTDKKFADNSLLSVGRITKIVSARDLMPGAKVALVGSASGFVEGQYLRTNADGTIVTTRISKAGDAGAPVIALDKENPENSALLGILTSRSANQKESYVQPIDRFLLKHGLTIYNPGRLTQASQTAEIYEGALAEMFVHNSSPVFVDKAMPYVTALQKAGITFPVPKPQPKSTVADPTEVRYFYADDEPIANSIAMQMKAAGFASMLQVKFLPDDTAPRKFIQISIAKAALP